MEIAYLPGTRDADELLEFVAELLQELRGSGQALSEARMAGIDVDALGAEPAALEEISIEPEKSGFDPFSTLIIVTIVRPIVLDLWRQVLLPRIVRRWGATAIGPEAGQPAVKPDGDQRDETPPAP
jgi:hypothetical protein